MDRGVAPPYLGLLRLNSELGEMFQIRLGSGVVGLPPGGHRRNPISSAHETLLLDWCAQYGLLGALPHEFHSVTLAARWGELGRRSPVSAVVKQFSRIGGAWKSFQRGYAVDLTYGSSGDIRRELIGTVVPKDRIPYGCPAPHADGFQDRPTDANWVDESLCASWGRYFPSVPPREWETHDYPCPLTEQFWHVYSEPIDSFLHYAFLLDQASRFLTPGAKFKDESEYKEARSHLEALLAPATQGARRGTDGSVEQSWRFPSLISAFAQMVFQDALAGRYRRQCGACHGPFVSDAYQARYCSEQCRHRQQKRELRAQIRQAKRMANGGITPKEIAIAMNKPVAMIRGWLKS